MEGNYQIEPNSLFNLSWTEKQANTHTHTYTHTHSPHHEPSTIFRFIVAWLTDQPTGRSTIFKQEQNCSAHFVTLVQFKCSGSKSVMSCGVMFDWNEKWLNYHLLNIVCIVGWPWGRFGYNFASTHCTSLGCHSVILNYVFHSSHHLWWVPDWVPFQRS